MPAATFAEKDGAFTNTEGRVHRVREALEPVGGSKPDWRTTCQIAKRLKGERFDFSSLMEVMEEVSSLVPSYQGISFDRLERGGVQWPCPSKEHPRTPILHTERFNTGKGKFMPLRYRKPAE